MVSEPSVQPLKLSQKRLVKRRRKPPKFRQLVLLLTGAIALPILFYNVIFHRTDSLPPALMDPLPPLVMEDGDPYIRALMRTISASESNVDQPYAVIYGGEYIDDFNRHPDRCVRIVAGPNLNNCSTAAGRYQFITTTWEEMAERYHPKPDGRWFWKSYSFEPQFQDKVVYAWLKDEEAWGVNISELLKQGKLDEVLYLLSGTWTSLGYGIETNSMSAYLPTIYQQLLEEELQKSM
ncbi:glycoside hydrolase family protein [Laspinema sp. A4]|uniref:glycoside hydrolase family 24 protein n=1 Tax=Laspinema sp. D2d TaxID=2953686 RepID=UPI0021BA9124|nr:glycoside hydrolase family protein [Laspinema sp. D2d]MCT7982113.1 glycoside hydrolase family protein [Laspinema sp. D2d]